MPDAATLADILFELSEKKGLPGAASARTRIELALDGHHDDDPVEWHAEEKDALQSAIYAWIDRDGLQRVPESVGFDLRYALFGERQDELGEGTYLFELERDEAIIELPHVLRREPARGQAVTIQGESWIVQQVGRAASGQSHVGTVHAVWHPG